MTAGRAAFAKIVEIALGVLARHQSGLMAEDWSKHEVELVVADYLEMLALDLSGADYNKAERNRALQALLTARSRGSIEFKHQNISAVMIEMGYPYVAGYKPAKNYQRSLLPQVVTKQVADRPFLTETVTQLVSEPAKKPTGISDLLDILVEAPNREVPKRDLYESRPVSRLKPKRNYLEQEARNHSLGRAGEELVLEFEQKRLWEAGAKSLAKRIEHVSQTKGDGDGFDVLSFERDGTERLVEVKTTRFGAMTPFYVTTNELHVSDSRRSEYFVYRLFKFGDNPRLFLLPGSLRANCTLEPVQFRAVPG